jgi:hypothetical protein
VIASLDGCRRRLRRFADPRSRRRRLSRLRGAGRAGWDAGGGAELKLFTHHVVREDLQALYGFRTPEELGFFGCS